MHEVVISRDTLLEPLSLASGITEKKSLMPYLANVLIHLGKESFVYSTDLEISVRAKIELKMEDELEVVVHGKKLLDILKELTKGDITVTISGKTLGIKQAGSDFKISLFDREEFPEVQDFEAKITINIKGMDLLDLFKSVSFAMGTEESRPVLMGVLLKGIEERLIAVATDGYRMAVNEMKDPNFSKFPQIVIPSKTVREVLRVLNEEDDVIIGISENVVSFSTPKAKISSRLIEERFPDYESAIPRHNRIAITVAKDAFYKGLRRVFTMVSRNEPVLLKIEDGFLYVASESDLGRATERIEIGPISEKKEFYFNGRFLMDTVSHIVGETLTIRMPEDYGAILIEDDARKDYINVIMPVKV